MSRAGNRAILRKIRQNNRAVQAQSFGVDFVSNEAKRRWILFGGRIEDFKLDDKSAKERPKRLQRAIRRFKRVRTERAALANINGQSA